MFDSLGASQLLVSPPVSQHPELPKGSAGLTPPPPLHPPRPHLILARGPCQARLLGFLQGIPGISSPGPASCLASATSRLAVSFIMAAGLEGFLGGPALSAESRQVREGRALGAESEGHVEEDEQNGSHYTAWHVGLLASGCFLFFKALSKK